MRVLNPALPDIRDGIFAINELIQGRGNSVGDPPAIIASPMTIIDDRITETSTINLMATDAAGATLLAAGYHVAITAGQAVVTFLGTPVGTEGIKFAVIGG